MSVEKCLFNSIKDELVNQGLSAASARVFANKAIDHYKNKIANSKDFYKECCDYAGDLAMKSVHNFKYKSPRAKAGARRSKRPQ